ncbi:hypothetical protein Y032_0046g1372 [Ancylostoma ceylanicum]|uniref:SCP domain-containing protein n=1 Tax=Ancylostoma ceylanicum TaxID=53326 RepID=A0A016UCN0_9BILA|nr:hypothetical protein Y032_0046g1372 [Ancylostoma ceylanicum]
MSTICIKDLRSSGTVDFFNMWAWAVYVSHLLILLLSPSFIFATDLCDTNTYRTFTEAERQAVLGAHNTLRETIAAGNHPNFQGKLPSAKNMYQLIYDCKMEEALQKEIDLCSGHATLSEQYGQNILVLPAARMPALGLNQVNQQNDDKGDRLRFAVDVWISPQTYYGLKNVSDYDDNRLYTFANMANGKTLRFGCGYKANCGAGQDIVHISCIYNRMGGYQHSVLYERGKMCTKNKDCTTYQNSKCDPGSHLCVFTGTPPGPGGGPNTKCPKNKGMGDPARQAILDVHNKQRSRLARGLIRNGKNVTNKNLPTASFMPKMVYDCTTEAEAIEYANTCELVKSEESDRNGYGENVFIYPAPNADPVAAFEAAAKTWWNQIFLDGINWGVKYIESLKDKKIDQKAFTQMAWAKSMKLGCGIQTCGLSSFIVCRYSPAGNILDQPIYEIGAVCSGCRAACKESDGLCNLG